MDVFIEPAFCVYYHQFPLVLVDIGSRGGLSINWKRAEKYLQVIGFEPDDRSFFGLINSMNSDSIKYLNTGLYRQKELLDFYLTREEGDSSILKPNRKFLDKFPRAERFDILGTTKIKTDTLDNQLLEHKINDVDFIKLDTQGSELFILQGATGVLSDVVFGLEIEVEFTQMYQDQPLFSDVDSFVRKFGFQLFDLRPIYWKRKAGENYGKPKGQIIYADTLYLRNLETFAKYLDQLQDEVLKKSKALRALSICVLYGYLDYALELLNATNCLFSNNESQLLGKTIKTVAMSSSKIPNFRGRTRVANALYALWKIFQRNHQGWRKIGSGNVLGNLE